jgi:hypothetical protein
MKDFGLKINELILLGRKTEGMLIFVIYQHTPDQV